MRVEATGRWLQRQHARRRQQSEETGVKRRRRERERVARELEPAAFDDVTSVARRIGRRAGIVWRMMIDRATEEPVDTRDFEAAMQRRGQPEGQQQQCEVISPAGHAGEAHEVRGRVKQANIGGGAMAVDRSGRGIRAAPCEFVCGRLFAGEGEPRCPAFGDAREREIGSWARASQGW